MRSKYRSKELRSKPRKKIWLLVDNEEMSKRCYRILRSELATDAEKSAAGSWLFTHGYRPEDA